MSEWTRPKRVVVVDADNPLQEIHGEFFWREDHDRIVASEREAAFRDGYNAGYDAASRRQVPAYVVRPRRRGRLRRLVVGALLLMGVIAYTLEVAIPALSSL